MSLFSWRLMTLVPLSFLLYTCNVSIKYQEQVYFLCILDNGDSNGESRSVANTDQLSDVSLGFFVVVVSSANNVSFTDALLLGLAQQWLFEAFFFSYSHTTFVF